MKYYGYYSAAADRKFGHALYKTPDGITVRVTEAVSGIDKKPGSKWNDLLFIGEITDCIQPYKVDRNPSVYQLLAVAQKELSEQKACRKQFPETGKCFCYTCPVVNMAN